MHRQMAADQNYLAKEDSGIPPGILMDLVTCIQFMQQTTLFPLNIPMFQAVSEIARPWIST